MKILKELLGRFIWLTARAWGGEAACLPASWACSQVCCQASRSRTASVQCVLAKMQNVGDQKSVRPAVPLASGGATEPLTESQMSRLHPLVGRGSLCTCGSCPGGSGPVGVWARRRCPGLSAHQEAALAGSPAASVVLPAVPKCASWIWGETPRAGSCLCCPETGLRHSGS